MVQQTVEVNPSTQGEFLCVATFLPVRRWTAVIPFFRMSSRVSEQLKKTDGLVRFGLKTDIPRKRFWTLSVWASRDAMRAFVSKEPHSTAVRMFSSWAGEGAAFVEYESATGRVDWDEANKNLGKPTFYFKPRG